MPDSSTIILLDDYDWNYANTSKDKILKSLESNGLEIISTFPNGIVLDVGGNSVPNILYIDGLVFDKGYYFVNGDTRATKEFTFSW